MKHPSIIFTVAIAAILSVPAWAGDVPPSERQAKVTALKRQDERLGTYARNQKGAGALAVAQQRDRVRSLIQRLERGEQVDPREIDTMLSE